MPRKYGELPWYQLFTLVASLAPLPVILLWTALVSSHTSKSLRRVLGERCLKYAAIHTSVAQQQFIFGTTIATYRKWTKQNGIPAVIDDVGEDAHVLWIGERRTDRVLFFCHGGCYFLPVTDFLLSFWRYVQLELKKRDIEIGIALLSYSLAPMAAFPTPAKQATLALQFILDSGVEPRNLFMAGDSAGGNLVLQVISNMLHPHTGIPSLNPSQPIRSIGLFSPWMSFTTEANSFDQFDGIDFLDRRILGNYGKELLRGYSEEDNAFAEPAKAPQEWFTGSAAFVDHFFVTAGEKEVMRDDIVRVAELLKECHGNVELVVQERGVHDDMFIDFFTGEKNLGSLTPKVIEWLAG
ncbi:Abhydrolase-3 domain-containing protein [Favolaschia claudopus]|uniref:Abhydrolase-3 domain-containing protein n=1 Tax=Favolaschia claudopus TaxID=2862362 RepID=A0AAW0CV52_9AGAR